MADTKTTLTKKISEQAKPKTWSVAESVWFSLAVFFLPQLLILIPLILIMQLGGHASLEATIDAYSDWILNSLSALFVTAVGGGMLHWFTKNKGGIKALGFRRTPLDDMITVLPVFVGYFLTISGVFTLINSTGLLSNETLNESQSTGFEAGLEPIAMVAAFITLVILAPIYEEALFRGFAFQGVARKYGFWPAAIITSGLFALAHGQLNVGIDTFIL